MTPSPAPVNATDPPRVLLIASDTIGERMAGTGIRYWNLARVLGRRQPVTLATLGPTTLPPPNGVTLQSYGDPDATDDERGRALAGLIAAHDVVVAQHLPYLYTDPDILASRYLVVDLYAPWIVEKLEHARSDPEHGEPNRKDDVAILSRLLALGDFFICASERQRDFWLGALALAGRLDLAHAQANPALRTLIDVVPFGMPETPPVRGGSGPRDTIPGITADSRVILWNGGIWNWLDPITAIRAMTIVARHEPRARLIFMGTRSPVAQMLEMSIVEQARDLARELGLLDRFVFFNDWVPYDERQSWLLDADVGVSLHQETLEARYAFRTRMLDNLWCGMPVVATRGDVLADLIESAGIGLTVPPADVEATAKALLSALEPERNARFRRAIATVAPRYTWEQVSRPLLAYCAAPWRLGSSRGRDPAASYVHQIERTYAETAAYARHLERVVADQQAALAAGLLPRVQRALDRATRLVRPRR